MKTLLLVRHAKSSWDNMSLADFDRPLNDRGKRDAPMMAERLKERGINIDAFIASPAKRAKKTGELFLKAYGHDKEQLLLEDSLYLAGPAVFTEVISRANVLADTIAIFSHNNGITDFANTLTTTRIDDMPTCSVFAIKIHATDWASFAEAEKEFWFFDAPKLGS